jgi:predicted transposase YdaD
MLITEWNTEKAKEVWFEEGMEKGMEKVARNALAKGIPVDTIHEITGIDINTIRNF